MFFCACAGALSGALVERPLAVSMSNTGGEPKLQRHLDSREEGVGHPPIRAPVSVP